MRSNFTFPSKFLLATLACHAEVVTAMSH